MPPTACSFSASLSSRAEGSGRPLSGAELTRAGPARRAGVAGHSTGRCPETGGSERLPRATMGFATTLHIPVG
eukprot:15469948-Alexandrium_andersonii.AAC.1